MTISKSMSFLLSFYPIRFCFYQNKADNKNLNAKCKLVLYKSRSFLLLLFFFFFKKRSTTFPETQTLFPSMGEIQRQKSWIYLQRFGNSCCGCLVTQLCPTLCDSMNCSPAGSFVDRIFQARILAWVAISFSIETGVPPQTHTLVRSPIDPNSPKKNK